MRYLPNTAKDQQAMLSAANHSSLEELFEDIPAQAKLASLPKLPKALSEPELLAELKEASAKNKAGNWLGAGSYQHFIPSVVKHLVSRSEFYTAYTPYQAEASQGVLQAIYEYQSMICELTGMDVANASIYDGATALVEAALLACRATKRQEIAVSANIHPDYRRVLQTYANGADLMITEELSDKSACYIVQQPNFFGTIEDVSGLADKVHGLGALFVVNANPVSLGLLKAPGDYGADVVVGEGQPLGNPQSFGGPGLGLFACKQNYSRQVPGRVVGATADLEGQRGFCLTLQTREQHIRRERATSNICTNEALSAMAATVYLAAMGKQGLRKVAALCLQKTNYLKKKLGKKVLNSGPTFNELVVKSSKPIGLDLGGFFPGRKGQRLICVTELAAKAQLDSLAKSL